MLDNYKKVMGNWSDDPEGTSGKTYTITINNNTRMYTNIRRITLDDGRRAWKTDQGTFLPDANGMPGGEKISD